MAVIRTARFKLHRWDNGSDPINRAQSDLDNLQVETLGAIFREGADADKGVASDAANVKSFYNATDTGILYYSNGSNWIPVNDYGETADISAVTLATSAAAGTSTEVARADHVHSMGTPGTPTSVSTASAATGSSSTPARSDHVHDLANGTVTEGKIDTGAVTADKIGAAAVTEAKIGTGAVTADKIGTGAVTEAKIGTGAVTPLKIGSTLAGNGISRDVGTGVLSVNPASGGGLTVSASGVSISSTGVTEAMLGSGVVTEAKIGTGAVTAGKIGTSAVTPLKIDSTIVGSGASAGGLQRNGTTGVLSVLADSTTIAVNGSGQIGLVSAGVGATQLASNSVVEAKIQDAAVTPLKISSTIVGSGASAGGLQRSGVTGVLSVLPDSSTVTVNGSGQIAVGTITNSNIGDSTISPLKITTAVAGNGISRNGTTGALSLAVGAGLTVDGTGVYVTTGGIVEALIGTGAVTEGKIGTGAVTEGKIGTAAVTAGKIGTAAVTPLKIGSTIVGSGASAGGLQRDSGTGVLSALTDSSTIAINGSGQLYIPANGVTTTQINTSAVTGAKAGAGVYRNVNSLTTGGRIEFTTVASLPTVGAALTGSYTNGDIIFGY